jgi:hypothetical protein
MEFTSEQKKTAIIAAGAAAGVAQTIILRKTMDISTPVLIPQLKDLGAFAKPSAMLGIAIGAGAIILSIFILKDHAYAHALTAYGGGALASGVLSGMGMMI